MSNITDSTNFRNKQYIDSRNLAARAALHERFSINPIGWQPWVYQQLQLERAARILEIGCGPGYLWQKNTQNLSQKWQIFLGDLSQGMLEEARASLGGMSCFKYTILDGAYLPFPESFFDGVIANHVLHHLPDVSDTLQEVLRVLQPGGLFYAATNGEKHLQEIRQWKDTYLPGSDQVEWGTPVDLFNLSNGSAILGRFFNPVHLHLYSDHLQVTEIEPIINYIQSYQGSTDSSLGIDRLRIDLEKKLSEHGSISISKETGLFAAQKPIQP